MAPAPEELVDGPTFAQFHQGLLDRLAAMPGVESVGLVNELPLDEGAAGPLRHRNDRGRPEPPLPIAFTQTGGDYFKTMRIRS